MPRTKRLDIIGGVYHIISRGIERREIFKNYKDKEEFLKRFNKALVETDTQCFAWVLMDNHFHMLLRPLKTTIGQLMRKVLSGYVGYFNARHKRVGHLFQNRYKSILCQEDVYFQELVRYIHLNPIRSKILRTPTELKNYPFCGHGALLGKKSLCNQETEEVLAYFGRTEDAAQISYLEFVKSGWDIKHKKEYTGGGLLKSAGGQSGLREFRKAKETWQSDYRILGDGDFVSSILNDFYEEDDLKEQIINQYWSYKEVSEIVCKDFDIDVKDLCSGRRLRSLSHPKGVFCYIGREYMGWSQQEIAKYLNMKSTTSVFKAQAKGKQYLREIKIERYLKSD